MLETSWSELFWKADLYKKRSLVKAFLFIDYLFMYLYFQGEHGFMRYLVSKE